jgi:uncharacterized repeat protein (TIGR02543 family)
MHREIPPHSASTPSIKLNALIKPTRYKNVIKGDAIGKLAKASRKGYVFKGWYTKKKGGERVTAKMKYDNAHSSVIYAHWED